MADLAAPEASSLAVLAGAAQAFVDEARAPNTRRAYAGDWQRFCAWAADHGFPTRPTAPEHVGLYLAHLASLGRKCATIDRALASIATAQPEGAGRLLRQHPAVREVLRGIHRTLGVAPAKKAALDLELLRQVLAHVPSTTLVGLRDRAVLLLGWFLAVRRSELVALDVADVVEVREGLLVTIRRSKTDQEGEGRKAGVPFAGDADLCPIRAVRAYVDAAGVTEGALFRDVRAGRVRDRLGDAAVAEIVKRAVRRSGIDPRVFAGHSLRSGFVTEALRRGKSLEAVMNHTGHRSERVARGYKRDATVFVDNAAAGLV